MLVGEGHLLEALGVRGGDLSTGDTDGRSVQVVEGVLGSQGDDLGGDTERGETGLDGHHGAGLLDGVDDGLEVEGLDGAEVDDLGLNAVLLLESLGGDEDWPTQREKVTMVRSLPERSILALPIWKGC